MKNLWPEKFEEEQLISPKSILEEQAKLLPSITDGIVYAEVYPTDDLYGTHTEFGFGFDISSKFLPSYHFKVLSVFHNITLYPVKIVLDEGIGKELGLDAPKFIYCKKIESSEELENFLGQVLKTERLKKVIGSIIRLSR
jgi:hypothetical protein